MFEVNLVIYDWVTFSRAEASWLSSFSANTSWATVINSGMEDINCSRKEAIFRWKHQVPGFMVQIIVHVRYCFYNQLHFPKWSIKVKQQYLHA